MPVFLVRKNSPFANILILVNPILSALFIVARSSLEGADTWKLKFLYFFIHSPHLEHIILLWCAGTHAVKR